MTCEHDLAEKLIRRAYSVHELSAQERGALIEAALSEIHDRRTRLLDEGNVVPLPPATLVDPAAIRMHAYSMPEVLAAVVLVTCSDEIRRLEMLGQGASL